GGVELHHPAEMVHRDDAIERSLEYRGLARLAGPYRLLRPDALDVLPELVSDRHHQVEQVGVGLGDRLGEELNDADHASDGSDRESEGSVNVALGRDPRAWEVGVGRDVRYPGRLCVGPYPAWQADTRLEGDLAAGLAEGLGSHPVRVPPLDPADVLA